MSQVCVRARGVCGETNFASLGSSSWVHQTDGMKTVLVIIPVCPGHGTRLGLATGSCSSRFRMLLPSLGGEWVCDVQGAFIRIGEAGHAHPRIRTSVGAAVSTCMTL